MKTAGALHFFPANLQSHLNPIEILWRKIKYEWIPYGSIENQQLLDDKIDEIIQNFGVSYILTSVSHLEKCRLFMLST